MCDNKDAHQIGLKVIVEGVEIALQRHGADIPDDVGAEFWQAVEEGERARGFDELLSGVRLEFRLRSLP